MRTSEGSSHFEKPASNPSKADISKASIGYGRQIDRLVQASFVCRSVFGSFASEHEESSLRVAAPSRQGSKFRVGAMLSPRSTGPQ